MQIGKKLPDNEKVDIFQAPEGELNMYYGMIGSGKTYAATADIHELLAMGRVVYATWPIKVSSFDDRKSFFTVSPTCTNGQLFVSDGLFSNGKNGYFFGLAVGVCLRYLACIGHCFRLGTHLWLAIITRCIARLIND